MPLDSIDHLIDTLHEHQLLSAAQTEQLLMSVRAGLVDATDLADDLVGRRWLTRYQAEHLLAGTGSQLFLGHYLLIEPLGTGGLAEVFKARHRQLDRIDALKVLRPEAAARPQALRCLRQEAKALARLSHPNIVIVYDAGEVKGRPYLAVEYVEGRSLKALVAKAGPLPVPLACDYAWQAALGLQHAFEREVVHRDINPSNLRLTADGTLVKILDLNLALMPHDAEEAAGGARTAAVSGTPDYMAPEQAVAGRDVDTRADIYGLGCTLYFLLTGRPPFPGGSAEQKLLSHHLSAVPGVDSRRADVPAGLCAVVRRMTAKKPGERFQSPAEAAEALRPFCKEDDVLAALRDLPVR